MKNALVFIVMLASSAACHDTNNNSNTRGSESTVVKDGVFIHITRSYDDPGRVLMPLKMATLMAPDKDVIVYLDIDAVKMLVKGSKDIESGDFESAHTYIKKLIEQKVGVYACPACLAVAGFKPEDLIEGVQIAQKDRFFNFTKGRIVNLDY